MENGNETQETKPVDQDLGDLGNVPIGEEQPKLPPKTVIVQSVKKRAVNKKDGSYIGDKLVLTVKHPDSDKPMEISAVKYQKDDKLKQSGLWLHMDSDGKLVHSSATAYLLRAVGVTQINELQGKSIQTVEGNNGYLIAKAY